MSEQTTIHVKCSCVHKEKFEHTVQTNPGSKKKRAISLQVECPFNQKEGCHKIITIPFDLDLENNDSIIRHGF